MPVPLTVSISALLVLIGRRLLELHLSGWSKTTFGRGKVIARLDGIPWLSETKGFQYCDGGDYVSSYSKPTKKESNVVFTMLKLIYQPDLYTFFNYR